MFLVLGLLMSCINLWDLRTLYFERKWRNLLGENETVQSFTFRDNVGANTGFNLSDLIFFMSMLVIQ